MARRTTIRCAAICSLALSFCVLSVVGVGIGVMPANGAVWSIDGADNIGVGYNENQTINGIKTRNGDKNIKIRVGDLVTKGAEFDRSNSSYTVADRTDVANSDVYIKNRNKKNATIVVNKSIPDGSKFDIKISNLSTRNISVYNEVLSYKDIDIEYRYFPSSVIS